MNKNPKIRKQVLVQAKEPKKAQYGGHTVSGACGAGR